MTGYLEELPEAEVPSYPGVSRFLGMAIPDLSYVPHPAPLSLMQQRMS